MFVLTILVWCLLALVLATYVWLLITPRDVDPAHLVAQSSVSAVRQQGESALLRSHVNPHGRPLSDGAGPAHALRLRDLWEPQTLSVVSVAADGSGERTMNISAAVQKLGPELARLAAGRPILLALQVGSELLSVLFSCSLYNLQAFIVSPTDPDLVDAAAAKIGSSIVVVAPASLLARLNLSDGSAVKVRAGDASNEEPSLSGFLRAPSSPIFEPKSPKAHPDEVQFTFVGVNGELQPVRARELASALVAQMRVLGTKKWTPQDRVLVFSRDPSPYSMLMQLTAVSCCCTLFFVEKGFLQPFSVFQRVNPTVMTTDDLSLRSMVRLADDFGPTKMAHLFIAKLWLSRGVMPGAVLSQFRDLRLVHTEALHEERFGKLEPGECNVARACLGTDVVHALTLPGVFGPVCQTRLGDYRAGKSEDRYVCFGPPLPGLEIKVDGPNAGSAGLGSLLVRGPASAGGASFTDLKERVELRGDGCCYAKLPDPIRHDIYYG